MARKKLVYLVLDCETATLPYAANFCGEERKKIAISKPLPYDTGWTLMYRTGEIIARRQFLVSEIFSVPSVFNTAYYRDKRPLYLEKLKSGEIVLTTWEVVAETLKADMELADYVGAYNAMFDFFKAIPFMELYIEKLYSSDYYEWEEKQNRFCDYIVNTSDRRKYESKKDYEHFSFRGVSRPVFDIWGLSCDYLLNNIKYKEKCFNHNMLTESGEYFKTSAESSFRHLSGQYDFDEAHTAMEDAEIESAILAKVLKRHAVTVGIDFFPFRKLGTTDEFVTSYNKHKRKEFAEILYNIFDKNEEVESCYGKKIAQKKNLMYEIMMEV